MKVVKPGLVHKYENYDCVSHCEAHIACLEGDRMNPPNETCDSCRYASNLQGYRQVCISPLRLESLKRFYYVDRYPVVGCHVPRLADSTMTK